MNALSTDEAIEYIHRIRSLESQLHQKSVECNRLTKEVNELRGQVHGIAECSFDHFKRIVQTRLGRDHGWRQRFIEQTGVSEDVIRGWMRSNVVPVAALEKAKDIKRIRFQVTQWTKEEKEFVRNRWNSDTRPSIEKLSKEVSKKFGRVITVGSIKGQLYNQGLKNAL